MTNQKEENKIDLYWEFTVTKCMYERGNNIHLKFRNSEVAYKLTQGEWIIQEGLSQIAKLRVLAICNQVDEILAERERKKQEIIHKTRAEFLEDLSKEIENAAVAQ